MSLVTGRCILSGMLRTLLLILGVLVAVLVAIALVWSAPIVALAVAVVLASFWVDRRRRARLRDPRV